MTAASLSAEMAPTVPSPVLDRSSTSHATPRKIDGRKLATSVLGRTFHPGHLWRAIGLHRARKANRRAFDDTRLALYARLLPSDFLHYGYFEDPARLPESISLEDVARAQTRYAELLLELIGETPGGPVLDIGCGMGGLSRMMLAKGLEPVALTPDKVQVAYINKYVPGVPVIRTKFEKLDPADHAGKYGSVVTAESLQYLKLDLALPLLATVLRPGGTWVACDYFLTKPSDDKTCHNWKLFNERITEAGWRITYQRDVTPHVLPTLGFIHMLATRFGISGFDFGVLRLRRKQPGLHHLLAGLLGQIEGVIADNIALIDPVQFARDRQYMLLKLERA